ncbi:MAG: hypothetical protein MUR51_10290 [Pseudomonadota bacterium]|nr:hypothetical protein [Pseudomonadota bacterium]
MRILALALFSLFSLFALADNEIETIQLNHRLDAEVLAEIQPFLPDEATARASNDFIILQASPKVNAEIKQLINQLDTPAQSLMISVLKSDKAISDIQRSQIDTNVIIDQRALKADISIRHWSTSNSRNKDQHYQARGIAGRPVMIKTGQAMPQKEQYLLLSSNGVRAVQTNTTYIEINNGFQAIANILPNHQVSVEIYPEFTTLSKRDGVITQSQMFTNIYGSVGTWLEIGQVSNDKNITQAGAAHYQTSHSEQQFIYIRVDEIISQ